MAKETYQGIFKLMEETHELGVEFMKLVPFPNGKHPSTRYETKSIDEAIREELADVEAAMRYFVERNPKLAPDPERIADKLKKFRKWGLAGLNKHGTKEGVYRNARADKKKAERVSAAQEKRSQAKAAVETNKGVKLSKAGTTKQVPVKSNVKSLPVRKGQEK